MLAGSREPASDIVCEMMRAEGARRRLRSSGSRCDTSPQSAALANGVAATPWTIDFTYLRGRSPPVIPAILPLAETTGATPSEVMAAFIVGAEVAARFTRQSRLTPAAAWHSTGVIGTLAVAAAAARDPQDAGRGDPGCDRHRRRSLRRQLVELRHHDQAAACRARGARRHHGGATRRAAASRRMPSALEGRDGYFETFSRGLNGRPSRSRTSAAVRSRDHGYKLKRYASGGLGHTGIDARSDAREWRAARRCRGSRSGITKYAQRRITDRYPVTIETAKFSLPYLAAIR